MCGAYGLYISEGHPENIGCFSHGPGITNQSMQLLAINAALKVLKKLSSSSNTGEPPTFAIASSNSNVVDNGCDAIYAAAADDADYDPQHEQQHEQHEQHEQPVCVTSSAYFVKFIEKWSGIWEKTGWVTKSHEPVKNMDTLRNLLYMVQDTGAKIELQNMDASHGLQKAKRLADEAAVEGGRIGCRIRNCSIKSTDLIG